MMPGRVTPLRARAPALTVDIGSRWSPEHMLIVDRDSGFYAERNPLMTDGELRVQSALLLNPKRASWWKRAFSKHSTKRK